MMDLAIVLENQPGALAAMGEALGRAGVSIEGGGAFGAGESGCAHFLFDDAHAARAALEAAGIRVLDAREVVMLRLNQAVPGQLGAVARCMAEAMVNIEVIYSDHNRNLVMVVDDLEAGQDVARAWAADGGSEGALARSFRFGQAGCRGRSQPRERGARQVEPLLPQTTCL